MKEVGWVLGISPRTAETHRARIMHRLGIHDVAGLVRYALGRGVVAPDPRTAAGAATGDAGSTAPRDRLHQLHIVGGTL